MTGLKIDYKKKYKDLYLPGETPSVIDVCEMKFIKIQGKGSPGGDEYQNSIAALYSLSYTIKMKNKLNHAYFEYVVPPLEGLWWSDGLMFDDGKKENFQWVSMIRQPEFVDADMFRKALDECKTKKIDIDFSKAVFETFKEGLCVQVMHTGPYSEEKRSLEKMTDFIEKNGLTDLTGPQHKHHEIYISDPRKTDPAKLKTVIRNPVKRQT